MQKQQETSKGDNASSPTAKATKASGESFNMVAFLQGTKEELGKVVWPSRQQLIAESLSVLLMVSLSAFVIYMMDNLFSWAASKVFG